MPKLRDIHESAKDTAKRLKNEAAQKAEELVDKAKEFLSKHNAKHQEVKVENSKEMQSECEANKKVYEHIASLKGQCDKEHVVELLGDLFTKLNVPMAPEFVLFQQDLADSSYSLSSRDCAWFDGQVDKYTEKLAECNFVQYVATEL